MKKLFQRLFIVCAATFLVVGTTQVYAQQATGVASSATVSTIAAALVAAAGDQSAIDAIKAQYAGEADELALALASASRTLAAQGDTANAASMMTQAITAAESASTNTQTAVGTAAAQVETTISSTDPTSANQISSALTPTPTTPDSAPQPTATQTAYQAQVASSSGSGGGGATVVVGQDDAGDVVSI